MGGSSVHRGPHPGQLGPAAPRVRRRRPAPGCAPTGTGTQPRPGRRRPRARRRGRRRAAPRPGRPAPWRPGCPRWPARAVGDALGGVRGAGEHRGLHPRGRVPRPPDALVPARQLVGAGGEAAHAPHPGGRGATAGARRRRRRSAGRGRGRPGERERLEHLQPARRAVGAVAAQSVQRGHRVHGAAQAGHPRAARRGPSSPGTGRRPAACAAQSPCQERHQDQPRDGDVRDLPAAAAGRRGRRRSAGPAARSPAPIADSAAMTCASDSSKPWSGPTGSGREQLDAPRRGGQRRARPAAGELHGGQAVQRGALGERVAGRPGQPHRPSVAGTRPGRSPAIANASATASRACAADRRRRCGGPRRMARAATPGRGGPAMMPRRAVDQLGQPGEVLRRGGRLAGPQCSVGGRAEQPQRVVAGQPRAAVPAARAARRGGAVVGGQAGGLLVAALRLPRHAAGAGTARRAGRPAGCAARAARARWPGPAQAAAQLVGEPVEAGPPAAASPRRRRPAAPRRRRPTSSRWRSAACRRARRRRRGARRRTGGRSPAPGSGCRRRPGRAPAGCGRRARPGARPPPAARTGAQPATSAASAAGTARRTSTPCAARPAPARRAARSSSPGWTAASCAGSSTRRPAGEQLQAVGQPGLQPVEADARAAGRRRARWPAGPRPGRGRSGAPAAGRRRPSATPAAAARSLEQRDRVVRRRRMPRRPTARRPGRPARTAASAGPGWWSAPPAPGAAPAAARPAARRRRAGARSCPAPAPPAGRRPSRAACPRPRGPAARRGRARRRPPARSSPGRSPGPGRRTRRRRRTGRATSAATASASRVLPTPPGPTAVTSRGPSGAAASSAASAARSAARPTNGVSAEGSGAARPARPAAAALPCSAASADSARRSLTPSLRSSADTWLSTVRIEMNSRAAISALVRCSPTAASTSASRADTPLSRASVSDTPTAADPPRPTAPILPARTDSGGGRHHAGSAAAAGDLGDGP